MLFAKFAKALKLKLFVSEAVFSNPRQPGKSM